jgi:hypothetical protein
MGTRVRIILAIGRSVLMVLLLLLNRTQPYAAASEQVVADPNLSALSLQYTGTMNVKAGDVVSIGWLDIAGFIESRNEPGFNQGLLPNHNWRGFLSAMFAYPAIRRMQIVVSPFIGVEHESSHATMGIAEEPREPYRMIYDHQYRKSLLNGLPLGARLVMHDELQQLSVQACATVYFLSKNTPELPGLDVASGGGLSAGMEYSYKFGSRLGAFASLFGRHIFRGGTELTGEIYEEGVHGPVLRMVTYPVINRATTFSAMAGIAVPLYQARRTFKVYLWYLHGNPYGYIDSRDIRNRFGGGFAFQGM